jgi:hypothetical protein
MIELTINLQRLFQSTRKKINRNKKKKLTIKVVNSTTILVKSYLQH